MPDDSLKQSDINLLDKNRVSRLILYLNNSNVTVFIKLCIESNILGK